MPEKKGLRSEHHGELNIPSEVFQGVAEARRARIAQLREQYSHDPKALQEIDVYAGDTEYSTRLHQYVQAMQTRDMVKQKELEEWFHTYYPDL